MVMVEDTVAPLPDQIASALPALVAYVDRGQHYRFVSKAYEERFGRTAADLRGRQVREVIGEQAYRTVRPFIERALHGQEVSFPADVPGADGRLHPVEIHYSPNRDAGGEVVGYYALIVDVSDAEQQARRQHERDVQLQMALEASGLGAWEFDAARRVVTLSPRTAEIFGLGDMREADWDYLGGLVNPQDLPRRVAVAEQALADGRPFEVEYRMRRPSDGVEIWVHTRGQASRDARGATVGLIGVLSDISRVKLVEAQLREDRQRVLDLERSQSFLLSFSDAIRETDDATLITGVASEMLGDFLGASRVGYGEVDPGVEMLHIARDWTCGVPSLAGAYKLPQFGPAAAAVMRSGAALVIGDVETDPIADDPGTRENFRAMQVRSTVSVPLVRNGRAIAVLFVHQAEPRVWTPEEVRVVQAVAERTWAAVARARSETTLRESEARFRIMADSAPAPVWVTGPQGGIAFVNQAFATYAGIDREQMMGHAWTALVHPEDLPAIMVKRDKALKEQRGFSFEARFLRHDGERRWMQALSNARYDAQGRFLGFVGIAMDLTEVRKVEAALRESEQRFRHIAEDAPIMMWICDAAGTPVYMNGMQRTFFGVSETQAAGLDLSDKLYSEDGERMVAQFDAALQREEPFWAEGRFIRADGEVRDIFTRAVPRHDAHGGFIGMIGVNVDVTDTRRAELHQQLLINELNHRVKNTLATVQSIAHQTLRDGVMTRDARQLFTSRLLALSAAHNVLTRENWERAELHEIAEEAVRAHQDPARARIACEGPQVRLSPKQALAISMALHELSTNAVKYGALSGPTGRVDVTWALNGRRDQVTMIWAESGGPPVQAPTRKGFGSRLLQQGLAIELGAPADVTYAADGLVCTIRALLSRG
jgi:PAS domain S-box-containing protein